MFLIEQSRSVQGGRGRGGAGEVGRGLGAWGEGWNTVWWEGKGTKLVIEKHHFLLKGSQSTLRGQW